MLPTTTLPNLNNPESFWEQGEGRFERYIFFNLNITEKNFEEVTYSYIDIRGRKIERRLCSRLDKEDRDDITGICDGRASFSQQSNIELVVKMVDGSGNSKEELIEFSVG